MPSDNTNEQQFTFLCLCAWLIKHKCQMNFQLEPEDYEDPNTTIDTILEAIRLLQADGNDPLGRSAFNAWLNFPPSRLKNASHGPEIVWIMNVLADRALELQRAEQRQRSSTTNLISSNNQSQRKSSLRVVYRSEQQQISTTHNTTKLDSVTIGQPLVGGGLTTRPLGTYRIDDDALLLKEADLDSFWNGGESKSIRKKTGTTNASIKGEKLIINDQTINYENTFEPLSGEKASEWYQQVGQVASHLETVDLSHDEGNTIDNENCDVTANDLQQYLDNLGLAQEMIKLFFRDSRESLETIAARIRRELQVIWAREKFIQTQANREIAEYLSIYLKYSQLIKINGELESRVEKKMASFERMNEKLRNTRELVEKRTRDLAEGKHLRELETKIKQLRREKTQFDLKIGLLLSVYANKQTQLLANSIEHDDNYNKDGQ